MTLWLPKYRRGALVELLQINKAPGNERKIKGEDMIPLLQPAYRPELNPIKQFWQLLKRPLKNQIFPSLPALRERVQELFDQLTLEQVMLVSSYNFISEALFYAASH